MRIDYTFRQPHSLSKSVWDTVNNTEEKILDVVHGGISQGRDIKTVAADLMAYMKEGPKIIPGRWGKLLPGTREYVKRFGKQGIDYRAMRLYRSEKYRQMQEAAVEDGGSNPACTGEYDWILMPGRETWNCDCPDIAAAGPYKANNIPPYRHPNCDCMIEPRMKDHDEFIKQLRDYVNGEDTPGAHEIEEWARENDLTEDGLSAPGAWAWTDDKNTPPRRIEHAPDYSEYSPAVAASIEGEYLRQYSQREMKEAMSIMQGNKVLGTWEGTRNRINIWLDEEIMNIVKKSEPSDLRIIHTHLDDLAFSFKDLTLLQKYGTIKILVAQGVNGNRYTMSIPDDGIRIRWFLKFQYGLLRKELLRERPRRSPVDFIEELNRRVADKMRWRFTPSSRKEGAENMRNANEKSRTQEEFERLIEEHEKEGLYDGGDDDQPYTIQVALQVAKVMGKDVIAFKKLFPQEQKEKYDEYKKEMDALSDEELAERFDKCSWDDTDWRYP